jgi:hypothetical protein
MTDTLFGVMASPTMLHQLMAPTMTFSPADGFCSLWIHLRPTVPAHFGKRICYNVNICCFWKKRFCATLCSRRWMQLKCLQNSGNSTEDQSEIAAVSNYDSDTGRDGSWFVFPAGASNNYGMDVNATVDQIGANQTVRPGSTDDTHMKSSNIHRL